MARTSVVPGLETLDVEEFSLPDRDGEAVPSEREVRDLMWRTVGLRRAQAGLERAVFDLERWMSGVTAACKVRACDPALGCVSSLVTVGWLMARAALRRTESRGSHFRTDFPSRDDLHWKRRIFDRLRA